MSNYRKILIVIIIIAVIMGISIFVDELNKSSKHVRSSANDANTNLTASPLAYTEESYYKMDEKTRMKKYVGEILFFYELKDYKSAYDRLNASFKAEYFPTLEDFEKYVKETYPENPGAKYLDFSVEGELFVIKITVVNVKDKSFESFNQRFVIRENGADSYTYSFQKDVILTKDDITEIPEDK